MTWFWIGVFTILFFGALLASIINNAEKKAREDKQANYEEGKLRLLEQLNQEDDSQ